MIDAPECQKMIACSGESQKIGNFLEWLSENGFTICETHKTRLWGNSPYLPTDLSIEKMLARYFEINLDAVEHERVALLDQMRNS